MEEDVRIVFTAGTHWISRAIRWLTRSPVSHVFIEYPSDLWGGRWVAEATKGGVRKVPASKARKHVFAEFRCKFTARPGLEVVSKYMGEQYDYVGAAILGLLLLAWRWLRVRMRSRLRSTKSQFCSEFVTRFFQGSAIPRVDRWDVEKSTPGRLYRFCLKREDCFKRLEAAA